MAAEDAAQIALVRWGDRWVRPALLGIVGSVTLLLLTVLVMGMCYIWLVTGFSPFAQVREGGAAIVMGWLLGGLFAGAHLAAAFLLEPHGPWGIAGITLCLLILWGLAVRRRHRLSGGR